VICLDGYGGFSSFDEHALQLAEKGYITCIPDLHSPGLLKSPSFVTYGGTSPFGINPKDVCKIILENILKDILNTDKAYICGLSSGEHFYNIC